MLTKDQIREKLLENPTWEPAEDAPQKDWEAYDAVYEEMIANGEISDSDEDDGLDGGDDWDDDEDDSWDDEE